MGGVHPRDLSEQILGALLPERVAHGPSRILALAVLADLGVGHGWAVLTLELVALVLGGHAVWDADEAAALLVGESALERQEALEPARFVESGASWHHGSECDTS